MSIRYVLPLLLAAIGLVAGEGPAPTPAPAPATAPAATPPADGVKPFPLPFCVTCGDKFGADETPVVKVHKNREVKMCAGCVKLFTADPDGYLKMVDQSVKTGKPVKDGH